MDEWGEPISPNSHASSSEWGANCRPPTGHGRPYGPLGQNVGQEVPPNTNRFQKFWLRWNREGRFRPIPPSSRRFLSGCGRSGQKCDIQNFENANTSKFHHQIRTNLQTFDSIVTARYDWGRSRPQFDDFSTVSTVFTENMHFHTSEPPKNRISQTLSKFSRQGSSRTGTDLSIAWKFCFFKRSLLFGTKLRSSVPSTRNIANHRESKSIASSLSSKQNETKHQDNTFTNTPKH